MVKMASSRTAVGGVVVLVLAGLALTWWGRSPGVTPSVRVDEPSATQLQTVAHTRVLFGHQSVGANVLTGIPALFDAGDVPAPRIVETRDAVASDTGFIAHAYVGRNGDPLGKLVDFAEVLDGPLGGEVDVALVKLCYVDIDATTDVDMVFDAYVTTMADLAARHPDVRFLFTTVPLTADRSLKSKVKAVVGRDDRMGPADNQARQRYNEMIREQYGRTGQLFDIAAVESTMLQGTPTERGEGDGTYYVLNDHLRSDRAHLNEQGAAAAAAELVRVVAANAPTT
jgi:hypothetical protein